jgi:hypothetical protein
MMKARYSNYFALVIIVVAFFSASCGRAQSWGSMKNATPEQRAEFQTKMMTNKLDLSPEQVKKVSAINLKYAQKFQPIIKGTGDKQTRLQQAMALQAQKDKELQLVFDKKQFADYQEFEEQLKSRMKSMLKD